jgi:photosystem II stability/assembly factor-like uncharacterized protein
MIRYIICAFVILVNCSLLAQKSSNVLLELSGMPATQVMADSVKKGFRGLSVVNEKVIWISGQRGLVGRSTDGGTSFTWRKVKSYEKMDFRTLHAFNKKCAVIATAGTPASILRTTNGGKTWSEVYRSDDSLMFFDGVGFWDDNRGLIFGDPIKGKMFLMETFDGGKTWKEIPFADRPQLVEGEAAFAASGTTIRTLPGGHVYIATGGVKSRLWHSRDYGHHWEVFETPIIQGKPSQGIFSMAWKDALSGVIVGGDYTNNTDTAVNAFATTDGGQTWKQFESGIHGYYSCVEYCGYNRFVACGPRGLVEINSFMSSQWNRLNGSATAANTIRNINGVKCCTTGIESVFGTAFAEHKY